MERTRMATEQVWSRYRKVATRRAELTTLRNNIATANDKLALKIAHRMAAQSAEPIDDLIQLARIGLLKAVEKFDPTKGVAFSSFAVPYIQGEILHFQRDHWSHVKVPRRSREFFARVKATQRKLAAKGQTVDAEKIAISLLLNGRYATQEAIAAARGKWQQIQEECERKPLLTLDEVLHHSGADELEDESEDEALRKEVRQNLAKLPDRLRRCIVERYFDDLSEEQIAKQQNVTVDVVQSWLNEGLQRLRIGHDGDQQRLG
ncbi:sigma-70 family RNA polymerase sigma factor [Oculatella sp. LEGE 06141]|uniref:sigma-70 family RNA polymerase sigma factor n=1 Tax=Oculatella sp. LEGE 06141 TaxID=1828648 RepID=UPI00187FD42D|nr:sigma-70 family RNA polymerase sigma factor [Oculatella sp. LEGE 06141]MBE9178619.1 sigma-70 family RNA polymerase sigma factor [Oculatella sp. LEGE 06141]